VKNRARLLKPSGLRKPGGKSFLTFPVLQIFTADQSEAYDYSEGQRLQFSRSSELTSLLEMQERESLNSSAGDEYTGWGFDCA